MFHRSEIGRLSYELATLGANPWFSQDLVQHAKEDPNRLQRAAKLALLRYTRIGGAATMANLATRAYRQAGEEVIGLGFHSVALKDGEYGVKKIHHRTHTLSPKEQEQEVINLERRQNPILEYFGEVAVAQSFAIEPFPLNPDYTCVIARQPRIAGTPSDALRPSGAFKAFLQDSRDMYDCSGEMPDIVGLNNVFETADGLALVDTIPLSANNPADNRAILHAQNIFARHGLADGLQLIA